MKLQEKGFGKFEATNGIDVVSAEYERGTKGADGKIRPHWNITFGTVTETLYMSKDAVVEHVTNLLTAPIKAPITEDESQKMQARDGCVHGVIELTLSELIDRDIEEVLNLMNNRLCEEALSDIQYTAVGIGDDGQKLRIRVDGSLDF